MPEIPDFVSDGPIQGKFNVNFYYEPVSTYGVPALISTPGLRKDVNYSLYTGNPAEVRAIIEYKGVLYIVCGQRFYSWTGTGTATEQSTVGNLMGTTSGPVSICAGYDRIAFVSRSEAFVYSYKVSTDTWTKVATPAGIYPSSITYQDGFYIIGDVATRAVYCSAIDDPASAWNVLNMRSKEGKGDVDPVVKSTGTTLWVIGKSSSEPWYYTAAATGLPFDRTPGALLDVGAIAPSSVTLLNDSVYWLNNRCEVCRTSGYGYEVISPPALNETFQGYARSSLTYVTTAIGFALTWEGHPWFVLTFPSYGVSWVYDTAAALAGQGGWFQWQTQAIGRHRSNCAAFFNGRMWVGDYTTTGYLYTLWNDCYTDAGADIQRIKYTKYKAAEGKRIVLHRFDLRCHHADWGQQYYDVAPALTQDAGPPDTHIHTTTTGINSTDVLVIPLQGGGYNYRTVVGTPSGGQVNFSVPLTGTALTGTIIYVYEYYCIYPRLALYWGSDYWDKNSSGEVGSVINQFTQPVRWASLGSKYDDLFSILYHGGGNLTLLGASAEVTIGKH